jgi:putative PEP-CTERM system histidine kinase
MLTIISITAQSVALAYLLYFFCGRKGRTPPLALSLVVTVTLALEFFDLLSWFDPVNLSLWKKCSLTAEAIMPPAWLWFSLTYARKEEPHSIPLFQRFLLAVSPLFLLSALLFPTTTFFYSPDFPAETVLFLGNRGFFFYFFILVYLITSLVNLETTLVNTNLASRWKIKFELLGAGTLLTAWSFYFSQGLLFRTIAMHLIPVRSTALVLAIGLMSYSRLKRGNGVKVYVSRHVAFKSLVILAVGLYLAGLGIMGEGMKYFDNGIKQALTIAFALTSGLGLLIVLLSETVKRRVRSFIQRNFYQDKYEYRSQWLQFTDHLSSSEGGDKLLHGIVSGFCDTFGMGCGALYLANPEHDHFGQSASIAMEQTQTIFRMQDRLAQSLSGSAWVVDLRDELSADGDDATLAFIRDNGLVFLVPLAKDQVTEGFIVIGKPININEIYNFEDFDLMKTLARQATATLMNLRLSEQLARAREMEALGKVSAFVMHDLKNLTTAMSLMLGNAREFIALPEFQDELIVSLDKTVEKMKYLIARLKDLPDKDSLHCAPVDLLELAHETAAMVSSDLQVSGIPVIAEVDREEFQKVALNLMLNAVEATAGHKPVTVEVGADEHPYFRIKDKGCGIPDDFLRNQLFSPFTTTKQQGLGIGLYQCKQIIEAHGGRIEVSSDLEQGSVFTVLLPKTAMVSI